MRCIYNCEKVVTGEVDRDKIMTHLKEEAVATPDKEERVKFVAGTIRGKQVIHYRNFKISAGMLRKTHNYLPFKLLCLL